jgi:hypothetical protein
MSNPYLLNAEQMANFVTDGYLFMENMVPQPLNEAIYEEQKKDIYPGGKYWNESKLIREAFDLPQVKGVIQSLLGDNPGYDHSFLHTVPAHRLEAQNWHGDSIIDTRRFGFDIQIFYFSHNAPKESGPTLVLPGSHLRRINTVSIGRYKNIVGQKQLVASAGTMVFWHQGLWHCAQPNFTDNKRYVFKLRLRPGEPQRALFNTEGYDSPAVRKILGRQFAWQGNEGRLEIVQRAKLWRYVTGDDNVDTSFEGALTRMAINP